jgi:hypothetical protein
MRLVPSVCAGNSRNGTPVSWKASIDPGMTYTSDSSEFTYPVVPAPPPMLGYWAVIERGKNRF